MFLGAVQGEACPQAQCAQRLTLATYSFLISLQFAFLSHFIKKYTFTFKDHLKCSIFYL